MTHWKQRATRCAMPGCERTRVKGWTTCPVHRDRGRSLYGLAPGEPRLVASTLKPCPICEVRIARDKTLCCACQRALEGRHPARSTQEVS